MKSIFVCLILTALAATVEVAFHQDIPSGAILIPVAAVIAFQFRGARSVIAASVPGLLLFLLRPVSMSLLVLIAPLLVAIVSESLARESQSEWRDEKLSFVGNVVFRAPWLAVALLLAHHLPLIVSSMATTAQL